MMNHFPPSRTAPGPSVPLLFLSFSYFLSRLSTTPSFCCFSLLFFCSFFFLSFCSRFFSCFFFHMCLSSAAAAPSRSPLTASSLFGFLPLPPPHENRCLGSRLWRTCRLGWPRRLFCTPRRRRRRSRRSSSVDSRTR